MWKRGSSLTPEELAKRKEQLSHPVVPKVIKAMARAQVAVFKATGGRIGSKWRIGAGSASRSPPCCSSTSAGSPARLHDPAPLPRRRTRPGGRRVAGRAPKNPQWYYNLKAHPNSRVRVKREKREVRARVANAEERAALWPRLVKLYADFEVYQLTTDRAIPVVILSAR